MVRRNTGRLCQHLRRTMALLGGRAPGLRPAYRDPRGGAGPHQGAGPRGGAGRGSTRGRAPGRHGPGSPAQQGHPLAVSLRTGEQLPALQLLNAGHVVAVPCAPHQGLQRLHGAAGGRGGAESRGKVVLSSPGNLLSTQPPAQPPPLGGGTALRDPGNVPQTRYRKPRQLGHQGGGKALQTQVRGVSFCTAVTEGQDPCIRPESQMYRKSF